MVDSEGFDLLGDLRLEGRLLVEASAGTGKTYTLAALATRYIAETEITIDQLLMVTFGKLAANELRDRVRDRMVTTAAALEGDAEVTGDDPLVQFLAKEHRSIHRERLNHAIVDFDTATITTIHSFAQQVRSSLGSGAHSDLDAVLRDDTDDLLAEVVTDVLAMAVLRDDHNADDSIKVDAKWRSQLVKLAKIALNNPDIPILPDYHSSDGESDRAEYRLAQAKSALLAEILTEVANRRRVAGTISYDDILTQLRDAIRSKNSTVEMLRRRFRVALVDEFQDTDPVQWEIFEQLFGATGTHTRLVLVGDPKQAIYGFRGANVFTYLEAANLGDVERRKLSWNHRSDGALIEGLEKLFKGSTLGHSEIAFQPVNPTSSHALRRLETQNGRYLPGLDVRTAVSEDLDRTLKGEVVTESARRAIAKDLARCVHELLDQAWIPAKQETARRRARPNDIAVLVSRNSDAPVLQEALRARGIPAVIKQGISVLGTEAADQWHLLLTALARPADTQRARRVALGWFFGHSAHWVATASDEEIQDIQEKLSRWSQSLSRLGIVEFRAIVWAESGVVPTVLQGHDGDRNMTDLNQISGLLQSAARNRSLTPAALLRILDHLDEIHDVEDDDVVARQVESEAMAVQILTIHRSKGLEFPIVCVPGMWNFVTANDFYQDPSRRERVLVVDRAAKWPDNRMSKERINLAKQEAVGENLRLLYVALTRAEHQTIVWWTRVSNNKDTGLSRLLFARDKARVDREDGTVPVFDLPPDQDVVRELIEHLGDTKHPDAIAVREIGLDTSAHSTWIDPLLPPHLSSLAVSSFHRELDRLTRRWSFSAMTPDYDGSPAQVPGRIDPNDESLGESGAADESEFSEQDLEFESFDRPRSELPLGLIPGGTQFGTLVHEVLQEVDFTGVDLEEAIHDCVTRQLLWSGLKIDPFVLSKGLSAAIMTPLGRSFGSRRLADIARVDRLDELSFELRLGQPSRRANVRDIGRVLIAHLPQIDPLRDWAQKLADGLLDIELAGHLTGSIDLVMRIRDPNDTSAEGRFFLADYKTNVLSRTGLVAEPMDYRQERLPAAMVEHHYPLQAVLYAVALHRYLRWRVPHYEPEIHFGGVAYLFLRGMIGPATPMADGQPNGVFNWSLPALLVGELSDLLDGRLVVR